MKRLFCGGSGGSRAPRTSSQRKRGLKELFNLRNLRKYGYS